MKKSRLRSEKIRKKILALSRRPLSIGLKLDCSDIRSRNMTATESPAPDQDLAAMEAAYEKMFDDRYSESDVEYTATVNSPLPDPPCVHNWFTRPKRDFNRGGWRGGGGRGGGHHYGNRDRGGGHHYGNRDRGGGHHYGNRDRGGGHHYGNRDRDGYHDRGQRNYDRREQGQGFDRQQYRDYHGNRGRGHDRYHPYGDRWR